MHLNYGTEKVGVGGSTPSLATIIPKNLVESLVPLPARLQSASRRQGRDLVIDLKKVTVISQEGQNLLAVLMNEGIKFRAGGVFAKQFKNCRYCRELYRS